MTNAPGKPTSPCNNKSVSVEGSHGTWWPGGKGWDEREGEGKALGIGRMNGICWG